MSLLRATSVILRSTLLLFVGISSPQILIGCTQNNPSLKQNICIDREFICLKGKRDILIKTNKGNIIIRLDGESAPMTSGNFLDLIERKVYDNTLFHRVIKHPVDFVVQGGDPSTKDPKTPKINHGKGTYINKETGEARYIPLEIKLQTESQPRYGQVINNTRELLNISLPHKKGSIAMARAQSPNSASSQFYIALKNLPELNGRYSVFGNLVTGMEVLINIEQGDIIETIEILPQK